MPDRPPKNYIGEWFGHRVYPEVRCSSEAVAGFKAAICPFLTSVTRHETRCVKPASSLGVCTITTTGAAYRDWMVCPYRSLDIGMMTCAFARMFPVGPKGAAVFPVVALQDSRILTVIRDACECGQTVFVFFQDKLGGEINLRPTERSPELSFDIVVLPIRFRGDVLTIDRFGIYEVQTMDFHGSYRHAVNALNSAVDLHAEQFADMLRGNPEWLGRGIEGPNIANVFKRTFYQTVLKFGLAGRAECAGTILGLPIAVWESWSPHLGAPRLESRGDYCVLQGCKGPEVSKSWILLFRNEAEQSQARERLIQEAFINVHVDDLLRSAFVDVPAQITGALMGDIRQTILSRVAAIYPKVALA